MKTFKIAVAVSLCALVTANTLAAESVTRKSGGLIQTTSDDSGFGMVNTASSLEREWITVHDDSIPADITGTAGVDTFYSGNAFQYRTEYFIKFKEELSAINVKFLLFDIWGEPTESLSTTNVRDMPAGITRVFSARWHASEHDVEVHYASIAYIARVRTKSGRVIEANTKTVLEEARKFSKKFSESDLESQPSKE